MSTDPLSVSQATAEPRSPLRGWFADPALVTIHGRWWMYPTTDGLPDWGAASFSAFSSPDLVNWTDHGEILRLGEDVAWASARAWAPALATRGGKYYLFFTADHNIGVAVSDRPDATFTDIGRPLIAAGEFEGSMIDPSVFIDDDGTAYLYWGNGVAYGVRLNDDMVSFERENVRRWVPPGFREAAWVHRRGDLYYLSWSENDTRSADYRVRYATGPGPLGPWAHQGILIEKDEQRGVLGTGHHSIARVPHTDQWVAAYHRFGIPGGNGYRREIVFAPLEHLPDGRISPIRHPHRPLQLPLASPTVGPRESRTTPIEK